MSNVTVLLGILERAEVEGRAGREPVLQHRRRLRRHPGAVGRPAGGQGALRAGRSRPRRRPAHTGRTAADRCRPWCRVVPRRDGVTRRPPGPRAGPDRSHRRRSSGAGRERAGVRRAGGAGR
jgi:hypothetical protein